MENTEFTQEKNDGAVAVDNGYGVKKDYSITPENKKRKTVKDIITVFLSAFTYVIAFHYFIATCQFASGGVGGVVAIVKYIIGATEKTSSFDYSSLAFLIVNFPLLIPAWKILGKEFSIKTGCTAILICVMMMLLDNVIDPEYKFSIVSGNGAVTDIGTRLLASVMGGALTGVALALAFKINSSTGGADIVGAMVQKKHPHKSVAFMTFAVNCVIIGVSFFVYKNDLIPVFLSLVCLYATTAVCDKILQGSKSALKFEVITEYGEEISKEIIQTLGHGVTITPAEGMFEHKRKQLLICVINPRQIARFQSIVSKYNGTFAFVGSVSEVIGKFNKK